MKKIIVIMISALSMLCGSAQATKVVEKKLPELVKQSDYILIATVAKLSLVDGAGNELSDDKARTGPGLDNEIRLHIIGEKNGILKATSNPPVELIIPLWKMWHTTLGSERTNLEGKTFIFLLAGRPFNLVYPAGAIRNISDKTEIETLIALNPINGFKPLALPLSPLSEQEYEPIFKNTQVPIDLLHQGLFANSTTIRAYSARVLGDQGNHTSIPYLIDALSDQSIHVGAHYPYAGMYSTRYWANESLKKLTKQDFGFVWDDSEATRSQAIQRWREWYLTIVKEKP